MLASPLPFLEQELGLRAEVPAEHWRIERVGRSGILDLGFAMVDEIREVADRLHRSGKKGEKGEQPREKEKPAAEVPKPTELGLTTIHTAGRHEADKRKKIPAPGWRRNRSDRQAM